MIPEKQVSVPSRKQNSEAEGRFGSKTVLLGARMLLADKGFALDSKGTASVPTIDQARQSL